jgi:hypothetical protein
MEANKPRDNWQYSMSMLASIGTPNWHAGVSAAYAVVPERLTASAYVFNGWDILYDNNAGKTFAGQLNWRPTETTTLAYVGIVGPEQNLNERDLSQIQELYAIWAATPRLSLSVDGIYGSTERSRAGLSKAEWDAVTLQAKYQVTPRYAVAPRIEYLRDKQGYVTLAEHGQDLYAVTLTQSLRLPERLETRFELRHDHSSRRAFFNRNGAPDLKSQSTASVAVLFGF